MRRVHDLLIAAGPPPEDAGLEPPRVGRRLTPPGARRWFPPAIGFAAALVFAAFAIGYFVGGRDGGFEAARIVGMHGVAPLPDAAAELRVGERDAHGNIPLEMRIEGLRPLRTGAWYELYLSKGGEPVLSCGTFRAGKGSTTVRLSIGYDLSDWGTRFDGWVITAHVPSRPGTERRVLLTT